MGQGESTRTNLIGHDHQPSVPQASCVRILLVMLKAHNLFDILNLLVFHDLVVLRLANVEQLAAEREHAEVIAADDTQTRHRQRFG